MKTIACFVGILGFVAICGETVAGEMRQRISPALSRTIRDVVRADAGLVAFKQEETVQSPVPRGAVNESDDDVLQLDRFVVREPKPVVPAVEPTSFQRYVATGALYEKVGRKTTKRFVFSKQQGIGLSISW